MSSVVLGESLVGAEAEARRYASAAGVTIRMLREPTEMAAASALLARVWHVEKNRSHVDPGMLVALAHSGNYVSGAYRGNRLVAVAVGFFHPPERATLHSHIAGVDPESVGAGIGKALKFHQRWWAMSLGATAVTWTFDPLVSRNAFFNFHRLGVEATAYLPDFYGEMTDGVNAGSPSDRMLVTWNLLDAVPRADSDDDIAVAALHHEGDSPVLSLESAVATRSVRIDLPRDIEELRLTAPETAARWRAGVRAAFTNLLADGWAVTDFDPRGYYRLERTDACAFSRSN